MFKILQEKEVDKLKQLLQNLKQHAEINPNKGRLELKKVNNSELKVELKNQTNVYDKFSKI